MQNMSPIPTIPIALRIRAARIPVAWTVRDHVVPEEQNVDGRVIHEGRIERVFWPQVQMTKWRDVEVTEIENPLELRTALLHVFHKNWNERAVLEILDSIGAWTIIEEDTRQAWAAGTYATVTYGHRPAIGVRVVPMTVDDLWREAEYWYKLVNALQNPARLRAIFQRAPSTGARPSDQYLFAMEAKFRNTLALSLEWQGKDPYVVIETLSGAELMIAAAWADVVGRAEPQVCAHCGTRFTWPRKKKHCRWECGHLEAVKKHKRAKTAYNLAAEEGYKGSFKQWQRSRRARQETGRNC